MLFDCFSFAPELSFSFCLTFWIKNGGFGRSGGLEFGCISPETPKTNKKIKRIIGTNRQWKVTNRTDHVDYHAKKICSQLFNSIPTTGLYEGWAGPIKYISDKIRSSVFGIYQSLCTYARKRTFVAFLQSNTKRRVASGVPFPFRLSYTLFNLWQSNMWSKTQLHIIFLITLV